MSAIAHLPGSAWAVTHRALVLVAVLAALVLAAGVTAAVVLLTGDESVAGTSVPTIPAVPDTCFGAPVNSAC